MFDIFKEYAVDLKAETEGVWRNLGSARFLIAHSNNENYLKSITEAWQKHQDEFKDESDEADEKAKSLMAGVLADTVLLGWENVGYGGKEMPYSREAVIKVFTDPAMKNFQQAILELAADSAAYLLSQEEEQTKNS